MKLNRILSSALIFVMLFATLITAVPLTALAAEEATVESYFADPTESEKDKNEVNKIYQAYVAKNCATAAELLAYDLDNGYLDYVKTPAYSIYVNRYTGFLYYVNNVTGQILTSNPIDPGYTTSVLDNSVLSQLEITYFALADPTEAVYTSYQWIKEGSLLKVTPVERDGKNVGISVEYTLGDVADTLIAPSALLGDSFREYLAEPILDAFATVLETYCGETDGFTAGRYTLSSYDLADHPDIVESNGEFNASQIRNAPSAANGTTAASPPTAQAIPLPPLKCRKQLNMCPSTTARITAAAPTPPAGGAITCLPTSKFSSSTGSKPLQKSSKKQILPAVLPTERVTLVAPILPEPTLRISMPCSLPIMKPNGIDPIIYPARAITI